MEVHSLVLKGTLAFPPPAMSSGLFLGDVAPSGPSQDHCTVLALALPASSRTHSLGRTMLPPGLIQPQSQSRFVLGY